MVKNIVKLSIAMACSLCFSIVGFVHAGSLAKLTDEDKKAVEEVSGTQENNKGNEINQENKEEKTSEGEKNKEGEKSEGIDNEKTEDSKKKENVGSKESSEKQTESTDAQKENGKSEDEKANQAQSDKQKAEVVEEMTEVPQPEPKNGDWYSQELSDESKKILEDFTTLVAEILEHAKEAGEGESQVQYRRDKANEFFTNHFGEVEEVASVEDIVVKSDSGNAAFDIPVRVYSVANQPSKNLLMYVHGGGWTQGNIDTHGYICRKLAKILNMDVASVDYRLAPENPYPTPLNDVFSVYKHYVKNSGYKNIVIAGDSAGGNLCAALCVRINEEGLRQPYAQILMYPPLGNNFESKSYEVFGKSMALSKVSTMEFFRNYTGRENSDSEMLSNKFVYPLLEDDMKVFPRTMIISAGYDVLLDDQLQFAEKLRQNDRFVWHVVDEGAVHGFMTYGNPYESLVTENCEKIKKFLGKIAGGTEQTEESSEKKEKAGEAKK